MATSAPCLAKAIAVEAPIPRVPPVTRAILPDRFMGAKVSVWPARIQLYTGRICVRFCMLADVLFMEASDRRSDIIAGVRGAGLGSGVRHPGGASREPGLLRGAPAGAQSGPGAGCGAASLHGSRAQSPVMPYRRDHRRLAPPRDC